mmetsp:Transcript_41228/g.94840  ORF Transcript_41228/g.94840 Transcript_41228/m.94840 type:complete len:248 (-) Transcript_41228:108-851(-)
MPCHLSFACHCETSPGEELILVGGHPTFGSWDPSRGVVMETSAKSFPWWTFRTPVTLSTPSDELGEETWFDRGARWRHAPLCAEYKYVVRRADGSLCWEEFGTESSSCSSSRAAEPARNRCLSLLPGPGVFTRRDTFRVQTSLFEAAWVTQTRWAPDIVGMAPLLGLRLSRFLMNGRLILGSALDSREGQLEALAKRIFVTPRRWWLLLAITQLVTRTRDLPLEVWFLVGEYAGEPAHSTWAKAFEV